MYSPFHRYASLLPYKWVFSAWHRGKPQLSQKRPEAGSRNAWRTVSSTLQGSPLSAATWAA